MTNTDNLLLTLQTMIKEGISVEMCLILKDMLEAGELNCRIDRREGKEYRSWLSTGSTRLLDRILAMQDETESLLLELLTEGKVGFIAGGPRNDLNVRWRLIGNV